MQIILTQNEIQSAMEGYLNQMLNLPQHKRFGIDFQTTRNPSGVTATVTIESVDTVAPQQTSIKVGEPVKPVEPEKTIEEEPVVETPAVKKKFFENL